MEINRLTADILHGALGNVSHLIDMSDHKHNIDIEQHTQTLLGTQPETVKKLDCRRSLVDRTLHKFSTLAFLLMLAFRALFRPTDGERLTSSHYVPFRWRAAS